MTFKMGKRRKTVSGSLTVEAALGLTLFVLFSVCMMMPMEMLRTRQKVQTVLEVTAREMSQYAYILYRLDQGDDTVLEESENWEKELSGLLAGMAVRAYLREKFYRFSDYLFISPQMLERLVISNISSILRFGRYPAYHGISEPHLALESSKTVVETAAYYYAASLSIAAFAEA